MVTKKHKKAVAKNARPARGFPLMPLGDRLVVKPFSAEDRERTLPSGIILPDTVSKEKTDRGRVVAVGEGRMSDEGKRLPMHVKVGDTVLFQWGDKIEYEKEEYYIVSENNILAVIN